MAAKSVKTVEILGVLNQLIGLNMLNDEIQNLIAKVNELESRLRNNYIIGKVSTDLIEELSSACSDLIETIDNFLED